MPLISDDVYNEIFNDSASEQVFYEVTPRKSFGKETQKSKYCYRSIFFHFQVIAQKRENMVLTECKFLVQ